MRKWNWNGNKGPCVAKFKIAYCRTYLHCTNHTLLLCYSIPCIPFTKDLESHELKGEGHLLVQLLKKVLAHSFSSSVALLWLKGITTNRISSFGVITNKSL
jgi:hypothetical protein